MQELKLKSLLGAFIALVLAVAASTGSSYAEYELVQLPLPLLIIGIFAGFLIPSFIIHPKASTGQTIQLTISGIVINAICLTVAIYCVDYFGLDRTTLDSDFILSINPAILVVSFLTSYFVLYNLLKFEDIKQKNKSVEEEKPDSQPDTDKAEENKVSDKDEIKNKNGLETVSFTTLKDGKEVKATLFDEKEKKEESKPASLYEEIYPQANSENETKKLNEEDVYFDIDQKTNSMKEPQISLEEKTSEENPTEPEEIKTDEESVSNTEDEKQNEDSPPVFSTSEQEEEDSEETIDFIPTDIRLIEAPLSKETESAGKIASIGKLLVNNKNIENVIESNADENIADSRANVVTSISGEEIYQKFAQIKEEFTQLKEMALIDQGGFIMANNFENKQRVQIAGALVAGAYHTLQNYLAQIQMKKPTRIFFETDDAKSIVIKTRNEILFSIWEREFEHINYGSLFEILEVSDIAEVDINSYQDIDKIINFTVTDSEGSLINYVGKDNADMVAAVSSAIFENLKVFMMNIELTRLSKITIFTKDKVLTIRKYNDGIATFIMNIDEIVKVSEDLLKMEEIY